MRLPVRNTVTASLLSCLSLAVSLPVMATTDNNCEMIKEQIAQRIINNGVASDAFTLTVVANDEAQTAQGKEVGYCGNQRFKIFYQRHNQATAAAEQPAQEAP